jgi:hypothetical protein
MTKTDLTRDSLREGLKGKGRARRQAAGALARASGQRPRARNDLLPTLQIESIPAESLRSVARRVRKSDAAHIREVANSITALGFNVPLLIGQNNTVLDGETRLEAARYSGFPLSHASASIISMRPSSVSCGWR